MVALLRPALVALVLLAPSVTQAKTKAPPTKAAAAGSGSKPLVKPVAAGKRAPAKPKAVAAKPVLPADRAEKDGFGVLQVASPDATKFMADWKLGTASTGTATATVADKPLFTFLIFHGCKPNDVGKCDVVVDFVIHRPDGTTNDENKEIVVWNKAAPVDPKKPYLGDGALGYGTDEDGPFGDYRMVATVTDRVAGVSVTTEQTLTIASALGAPTPPPPATTDPPAAPDGPAVPDK